MNATRRSGGCRLPGLLLGLLFAACLAGGCSALASESLEAERLAAALGLRPGMVVADVGAGDGDWTSVLAAGVAPGGRVYATEVAAKLEVLRQRVAATEETPVVVLEARDDSSALPDACCDAILLRQVYHHFTDPAAMRASLRRALRPGGRLVVVDIVPQTRWSELPGVPERGGHGITADDLVAEMAADGYELASREAPWAGDEDRYCLTFRVASP